MHACLYKCVYLCMSYNIYIMFMYVYMSQYTPLNLIYAVLYPKSRPVVAQGHK